MSFKDWITYLIKQMVWFMETPRTERRAQRLERKEPWLAKWFGMIPMGTKLWVDQQIGRFQRKPRRES